MKKRSLVLFLFFLFAFEICLLLLAGDLTTCLNDNNLLVILLRNGLYNLFVRRPGVLRDSILKKYLESGESDDSCLSLGLWVDLRTDQKCSC